MNVASLHQHLSDCPLVSRVEYHPVLPSTNARAHELARAGAPEGLLVVADTQTAGRGRLGSRWADVPGGCLLFSLLVRPWRPVAAWPLLGLGAAAAAAQAARDLTGVPVHTKWPNDVVVLSEGARSLDRAVKIGGVLVEAGEDAGGRFGVIGVGMNVGAAPSVAASASGLPAGALAERASQVPSREELLARILGHLAPAYESFLAGADERVLSLWRRLDMTTGLAVTLHVAGEAVAGVVRGTDETGALVLETPQGPRRFLAGEVRLSATLCNLKAGPS